MSYSVTTDSEDATRALGRKLAQLLHGGEIIELTSDLGGGKTTFVQGLAAGLGYSGDVTSPTFVLGRVYKINDKLQLHHYDLYRLGSAGVLGEELAEDLADPEVITVIEWAELVHSELPKDHLRIGFQILASESRQLVITSGGPKSLRLEEGLRS